jgi:hypothetical protein
MHDQLIRTNNSIVAVNIQYRVRLLLDLPCSSHPIEIRLTDLFSFCVAYTISSDSSASSLPRPTPTHLSSRTQACWTNELLSCGSRRTSLPLEVIQIESLSLYVERLSSEQDPSLTSRFCLSREKAQCVAFRSPVD